MVIGDPFLSTPYRETNVNTSYMRIPYKNSSLLASYTTNSIDNVIKINLLVAFQSH